MLRRAGLGSKGVYVIAEAGVNHNGSLDLALQLVDVAAEAGADAVKFQTFRAQDLATVRAPKADYQVRSTGSQESQLQMLKKLQISPTDHRALIARCRRKGLDFLSSPFDARSLSLLVDAFSLPVLKIPSGEITNAPLLLRAAQSGRRVILSTGMSTLADIEAALGVLAFGMSGSSLRPSGANFAEAYRSPLGQKRLREKVVLLHCVTDYPTRVEDVNLRNVIIRGGYRLIPWWVRRAVYRPILSRGRGPQQPAPEPAEGDSGGQRNGEAPAPRQPVNS